MPKRKKRMTKAEKELLAANARIGGYEAKFRRQEAVIDAAVKVQLLYHQHRRIKHGLFSAFAFLGWAIVIGASLTLWLSPETFFDLVSWHG